MIRATLFACVIVVGAAGCRDRARTVDESSHTKPVETETTTDRIDRTMGDRTVEESSNPVPPTVPAPTSDEGDLQPDVQGRAFESTEPSIESGAGEMPPPEPTETGTDQGQGAGANASPGRAPTTIVPGSQDTTRAGANTGTGTTGTAGATIAPNSVDPQTGTLTPQTPSQVPTDRNTNAPIVEPSDTRNTTGTSSEPNEAVEQGDSSDTTGSPGTSDATGRSGTSDTTGSSGTSETASGHGSPTNTGINTENQGTGGGAGGTGEPNR